ncbi:SIR2 family NAD-dependent protein deacylase [Niveibacterium terrae]|uniref:SIR2 family NAD-dependent protein deacylase n=1 Tax=Niveibacterium terrae TaxID=3373598 RepID=UPI003A8E1768
MVRGCEKELDAVASLLASAKRVLFITGAGISADSGLPTYRGINGLYNDQATEEGVEIEEALSGDMLETRPEITWKYLAQIEAACLGAQPNFAHQALARIEREKPGSLVLTQNIDGLHHAAGSRNLIEIHGSLRRLHCTRCAYREDAAVWEGRALPPLCPACQGPLRPDVVLFGEMLGMENLRRLQLALQQGFDMVFSVGTSSVFPYIVEPVAWAIRNAIPSVEINPLDTQISEHVRFRLPLGAAEAMQALMARAGL